MIVGNAAIECRRNNAGRKSERDEERPDKPEDDEIVHVARACEVGAVPLSSVNVPATVVPSNL